jgi:DHA1 family tetracycline resistance protein-like MFS transporter
VLSGVTSASVPTAFAYIADVTPPEKRARAFGLIGAAFGAGFVVGPALGGLLSSFGPRTPFWVAACFSLANAAYGYFVLPESLTAEHRHPFSWRRASPLGSLRLLRAHHELLGFASVHFLYNLAHHALQSVFVLYASYRFGWTSTHVGLALAFVGVCFTSVQAGLVGRFVARFGERAALLSGLSAGVVGFLVYGFAPTGGVFLLGIPIMSLWGLYGPAAQGLMTRRVDRRQQGALQGALSSVQMATGLFGPLLFSQTFAGFISSRRWHLPGAPYLLAAVLLAIGCAIAYHITKPQLPSAS